MYKSFFVTLLILSILSAADVSSSEIEVQISGAMEKISSFNENEVVYFSFSQLAELLGERLSWDVTGLSASYTTDRHHLVFFIDSPYIKADDTVKNLTYPVKLVNGNIYLPARTFIPLFDLIHPERITWDEGGHAVRIDSEWYNVTDIALSSKANGLLIEIFMAEPRDYEIYTSEGNWLNVSIPGGIINRRQILSRKSSRLLLDLNAYQFEGSAQISFRLRKEIGKYTHRFAPNPGRIQISLIDTTIIPEAQTKVDKLGPDDHINKIIIDAGHGGKDYGAIGIKRSQEKDIVLDIAKRLSKLIRKEKIFEVVMTREKDDYVSLEERSEIANKASGDIYVSIHANASPNRSARGFQVFFLAPANNDAARAAAQLENAPFLRELSTYGESENDLNIILSDMIQTEFQVESADLAAMVDKEFRRTLNRRTKARGIDQAGFMVLNQVYMPSVLIEAAFLTNQEDEELLKSKKYRQDVAEAIYSGLKRFKAKYEKM
jgi:N-acetylmuramoyl-L-alanine amidase